MAIALLVPSNVPSPPGRPRRRTGGRNGPETGRRSAGRAALRRAISPRLPSLDHYQNPSFCVTRASSCGPPGVNREHLAFHGRVARTSTTKGNVAGRHGRVVQDAASVSKRRIDACAALTIAAAVARPEGLARRPDKPGKGGAATRAHRRSNHPARATGTQTTLRVNGPTCEPPSRMYASCSGKRGLGSFKPYMALMLQSAGWPPQASLHEAHTNSHPDRPLAYDRPRSPKSRSVGPVIAARIPAISTRNTRNTSPTATPTTWRR